jgi:hypothetical protein
VTKLGESAVLASELTRADGAFRLGGLPAGRLAVATGGRGAAKTVALDGHSTKTGLVLVVARPPRISGVAIAPDGTPIADAEITARPQRTLSAAHDPTLSTRTFSGRDGRFALQPATRDPQILVGVLAELPDAEVPDIAPGASDVRLQFPQSGSITGTVVGPDGRPVAHYTVTRLARSSAPDDDLVDTVHDPAGRFLLHPLGPGTHDLRVRTAAGATAALKVELGAGENKQGIRVVLAHAGAPP